ncbi:MAG TPA: family 20 glycosylhydrolase, partial [Gemmatimonadales bacterium]
APAAAPAATPAPAPATSSQAAHAIIPAPVSVEMRAGQWFVVDSGTVALIAADAPAWVDEVAPHLVELLRPRTGNVVRRLGAGESAPAGSVLLRTGGSHGAEGYMVDVTPERVTVEASEPAGLFYGLQSLRQLATPSIEAKAALRRTVRIAGARVVDQPRFTWRGAMLDVSRHFLEVDDVKRYIDLMALYKLNRLHLHLSDDQGWRIEIRSWPNLAKHGGATEVGGGPGGWYTQEQYSDIVAYAAARHVTIVPEIDMPGHTNAALSSYPELNCDDKAPPPYFGVRVGFSALCVERDTVTRFVDDVVRELAALTPGPWIHLGGDEVEKLTHEQYLRFIERIEGIVRRHGKTMIGWGEIAPAKLDPGTIVQHWRRDSSAAHAARGGKIILSPASKVYIDQKHDSTQVLGHRWAGIFDVRETYGWEPATYLPGVGEPSILGVEAPLWAETLEKLSDYEHMAFPRLTAVAELGWSSTEVRGWEDFRRRLAAHGLRLQLLGVNFYRSTQVDWER